MKFNKTKYDNEYAKNNYDRIPINVPKGQKELIKSHALHKGFESINAYVNDLIKKDMEGNVNINVNNVIQSGNNNKIEIGR